MEPDTLYQETLHKSLLKIMLSSNLGEAFKNKRKHLGAQIRLDPPTLANLGILNWFFIADLAGF